MGNFENTTTGEQTLWLTVDQARRIPQVSSKVIYNEIRAGRLRAARIGGKRNYRIHQTWIDEWLQQSAEPIEVRR
jgi:excisionase family DNA binding protein